MLFCSLVVVLGMSLASSGGTAARNEQVRPDGLYPEEERYGDRLLALTFDDGLMRDRTAEVLDELKERNLHATFFVSGHTIRRTTWHLIRRMVDEGHALANHSWTHDQRMALRKGSVADHEAWLISEIVMTQIRVDIALLAENTDEFMALDRRVFQGFPETAPRNVQVAKARGIYERHAALMDERGFKTGEHPRTLRFFRPPGGSPYLGAGWKTSQQKVFTQAMKSAGVLIALWDHSTRDSIPGQKYNEQRISNRVAASAKNAVNKGGILLAHDRLHGRPLAILLDTVAIAGERLVTLDELYRQRIVNPVSQML